MIKIYVLTQNVKIDSLRYIVTKDNCKNVIISTNALFDNEKEFIKKILGDCEFFSFSDFFTDAILAGIDEKAFKLEPKRYTAYERCIKELKNLYIINELKKKFINSQKFLLSFHDDLGVYDDSWEKNGYKKCSKIEYYYTYVPSLSRQIKQNLYRNTMLRKVYRFITNKKRTNFNKNEIYVAINNKKKYIFIGRMYRIGYRLDLTFRQSDEEAEKLNRGEFYDLSKCQYLTTWHEHGKCKIPDDKQYDVRWMQDGYLPPNYSDNDLNFKPKNVSYYVWDNMGAQLFLNKNLPCNIIPFRKKLYMPMPVFPKKIKTILFIASGSGDWTALKNRSDDDMLVQAAVKIAEKYPEIKFVYRCHPSWVHPLNVGVNAINRVANYFRYSNLPNLVLSSNVPQCEGETGFQFTFARNSLEEDLKKADLVLGEHSVSMIDAAFKQIPFSSVNLTGRRNFYISMTNLGFPHCSSIEAVYHLIDNIHKSYFQLKYNEAVYAYNKMTDEDEIYKI